MFFYVCVDFTEKLGKTFVQYYFKISNPDDSVRTSLN